MRFSIREWFKWVETSCAFAGEGLAFERVATKTASDIGQKKEGCPSFDGMRIKAVLTALDIARRVGQGIGIGTLLSRGGRALKTAHHFVALIY